MKSINFFAGIAFGIVVVVLLYGMSQIVPNVTGFVTGLFTPEWNETWECQAWITPCGVITDPRGVVINNTIITWEELGCPVGECFKAFRTRTTLKEINVTAQPSLNQTQ